ncbi:MAG: SurA N-terminal domain-containing protein [Silicimonas sp.]|nr:SurA N-terminal domain-containing protein [Silicimonas sp.]
MAKKKGMGTGMWLVMGLLILSLGGFGITQFGGSVQSVARVGDVEISANEYARAVQAQMNTFQRESGQRVTFEMAQALGIDRIALGQLITSAAVEDETRRIGISAGDATVVEEIQGFQAFQGLSGEFSRETYEMALRQNGMSVKDFEDTIRSDIASELVRRAVGAGLTTPDVFVDTLYAHARESRDITWARLTAEDLPAPLPTPTEAELTAYHSENAEQFTRPETKTIRYAWLTPDMLAPKIVVSDEQLRTLYDSRIDEFVSPERRLVERLVFSSEGAAEEAKARLDSGEITFDDLVAERGLSLDDVDMGDVAASDLGAAADAVFGLGEPGVVGPLSSDLGPAIFRMNGVLAAENVSFEIAKQDLAPEASADRARRMIGDMIGQIEDLLAGGADPALIAERTDLFEGTIDWNVDVFDGVAAYDTFRAAAVRARPGDFGEVLELDDGGIVTFAVEDVREPELIPFEEVREEVVAAWEVAETQSRLEALANDMAQQLREGREMAALDLNLRTQRGLTRDGFVEGTPPDFTRTVFELDTDGIAVLATDGDAWLVRLDNVLAADSANPEAQLLKEGFAAETARSLSSAIINAYTQALIDEAGADIDANAVRAVNAAAFSGGGAN